MMFVSLFEIGNKIFYTKPERADDLELIKELCVYDRSTKKSEKLLGLKDDLRSLISIKNILFIIRPMIK